MLERYLFTSTGPQPTHKPLLETNLVMLVQPSVAEISQVCDAFDLEKLTFKFHSSPEEVSRFHTTTSDIMIDPQLLVIYDFIPELATIEQQLTPVIIVFDNQHLIICTDNRSVKATDFPADSVTSFVIAYLDRCQDNLTRALMGYKPEIDRLDKVARKTIDNDCLRKLTDLTRHIVFFDHTMTDQGETLAAFLKSPAIENIPEESRLNIQIQQRRLNKAIHIFRDLLDSIGSLFTSMMDSNLNNLMKFLDSAGIVIAAAALISGFMGMNVGGLPWKGAGYGFAMTLGLTAIVTIALALYLRKKKYLKWQMPSGHLMGH